MKNMKISMKLVVGFLVVIVFAIIVGGMGIFGMYRINAADNDMYEGNYLPTVTMDKISQTIVTQRVYLRNFVIYDVNDDAELFKGNTDSLEASKKEMEELFAQYEKTITNSENRTAFSEFLQTYRNEWIPLFDNVYSLGVANKTQEAKAALIQTSSVAAKIGDQCSAMQEINLADGKKTVDSNSALFNTMTLLEAGALLIAVAVALFFAFYISSLISKPMRALTAFMEKAGTTGDITLSPEDAKVIGDLAHVKDEIGQCIGSTSKFVEHLTDISVQLEKVAGGDLTAEVNLLSPNDVMGVSLNQMVDNINDMFGDIRSASDQVSSGAGQVSQGAQGLASGSSQQAASIQELSASLSELQEKTNHNAEDSGSAREANNKTSKSLDESIQSMEQMLEAMKAIDESSSSITKVIKVIDDIAFQTNILALNAAVEAARAGQHGKGFAVVADEVRNLAAKSAEAAKETSSLIEGSTVRVREGNEIVSKTNANLETAVESAKESTRLIEQVANASIEQAKSINEINQGMDQISTVVQANSATAEQSAAASEEMSAQAVVMNEIVAKFKLKQSGNKNAVMAGESGVREYTDSTGFAIGGSKY